MAKINITQNVTNQKITLTSNYIFLDILGNLGGGNFSLSYTNNGYTVPYSECQNISTLGEGYELFAPRREILITVSGATNPNLLIVDSKL